MANVAWGGCPIQPPPLPVEGPGPPEGELEVVSGRAEVQLGGQAVFSDDIILRSGDRFLSAAGASYDFADETIAVDGAVEYRDPLTKVVGEGASFSKRNQKANIEGAEFQVWTVPARGSADEIDVVGSGQLTMRNVTYTACPDGNNDWLVRARKIEVDQTTGYGTARDAKFEIRGVPVMYLPYFTYPISNERKTGLLAPDIGTSSRRGIDIAVPWYWNIAPNYDATLIPRLMTDRGVQLGGEFRYLTSRHAGNVAGAFLYDDDETGTDRSLIAIEHQSALPFGWRASVDAANVSDETYFEDFGRGIDETSLTHLPRLVDVEFFNGPWAATVRIENYQTLDETLLPDQKPYTRIPQVAIRGFAPDSWLGFDYDLVGDLTYFDRNTGVTGLRGHVMPTISRPIDWRIFELTPTVSLEHTRYDLSGNDPGTSSNPTRTAPIVSLDLKTSFERFSASGRWITTLEPRVLYTYIPFRNQDEIPIFDTIDPELNMVQLFRKNRFIGYDRLADTNQVALGFTTRLIDSGTGIESLRLTMGQLQYLSTQDVTLPGELPNDSNSSDYIAEFGARIAGRWQLGSTFQWNSDDSETRRATANVRYQRDSKSIIDLGYQFRRDSLEDVVAAAGWPIAKHWNFVGRFIYSLASEQSLEQFAALEYETCCWAIRANWRRYVSGRGGEKDDSFGVQFILKGLSDPGTAAEKLLGYGNLSY
ncbi:MAG: LPS assembly protein LptD [Gammaproteobacteria bacterium]|nr:LPS assembly protein LptD [Gammaproteobacteria bacterium]